MESVAAECFLSPKLEVYFAWARRLLGVTGCLLLYAGLADCDLIDGGGC